MPLRRTSAASSAGAITRLCPCGGARVQLSQVCCTACWRKVPRHKQQAYLAAKDGDCDSGPALEQAAQAIRDHLRGVRL